MTSESSAKGTPSAEKSKTFNTGMTIQAFLYSLAPIIVSFLLVWRGKGNDPLFPAQADLAIRYAFVYAPIAGGIIIILILLVTIISNMFFTLVITPDRIEARKGKKSLSVPWKDLTFVPPVFGKKMLRYFLISDGKVFFRVNEIFFPRFERVVKVIMTAKRAARQDKGYDI